MRNTTLCYIERGEQYLMLHRVKKEHDLNHDKWVGIGGKFEASASAGRLARWFSSIFSTEASAPALLSASAIMRWQ